MWRPQRAELMKALGLSVNPHCQGAIGDFRFSSGPHRAHGSSTKALRTKH